MTGSGTTAIAAIANNRRYIGIEKEEKYCRLAGKNIEKAGGEPTQKNNEVFSPQKV